NSLDFNSPLLNPFKVTIPSSSGDSGPHSKVKLLSSFPSHCAAGNSCVPCILTLASLKCEDIPPQYPTVPKPPSLEVNARSSSTVPSTFSNRRKYSIDNKDKETIDFQKSQIGNITDKFVSRGILSYEVQYDYKPYDGDKYLIITWAIKSYLKKGRNSITINICDKPVTKDNHYSRYKELHSENKRKYPGSCVKVSGSIYNVCGSITDGTNAEMDFSVGQTNQLPDNNTSEPEVYQQLSTNHSPFVSRPGM
ncbi:7950_t:CDS:2, partial [Diversispora eburnea]